MRRYAGAYSTRTPLAVFSLDDMLSRLDLEHGTLPFFLVDPSPGPEEFLHSRQAGEAIRRFVAALPVRDRTIVHRLFWADHTQTAIAADLGVSKMAISKALARVVKQAREALGGCTD